MNGQLARTSNMPHSLTQTTQQTDIKRESHIIYITTCPRNLFSIMEVSMVNRLRPIE